MAQLTNLVCVKDIEREAMKYLAIDVRDYIGSGALSENTLKENIEAMKRWYIVPHFLLGVSKCDVTTTVLGHKIKVPFGISPTGMQKVVHPEGEAAVARAASKIGAVFTLSTSSTTSLEIVSSENELNFFQLYACKDRNLTIQMVRRAQNCGCKALVVTVDTPILGIRYSGRRNNFKLPSHLSLVNFNHLEMPEEDIKSQGGYLEYVASLFDDSLTWEDIKWLRSITNLPIVLKGILTTQDAIKGIEAGVEAIWVSNHGGRQIDGVMSSIEALPEIVAAVGHKCEVYVDGGFRTGSDIFKGLALGANMVFLGRPFLWGLACGGSEGVSKVFNLLKEELLNTMCLAGCSSLSNISRDFITKRASSML